MITSDGEHGANDTALTALPHCERVGLLMVAFSLKVSQSR